MDAGWSHDNNVQLLQSVIHDAHNISTMIVKTCFLIHAFFVSLTL